MIRYIENSEIDYKRWDDCLQNSLNNSVYACSWYLDKVAGEWGALVEDDYEAVMPLPYRKKYGIHYIYQPPYTQQLGLFSGKPGSEAEIKKFIEAIPRHFRLIEYNMNSYNSTSFEGMGENQNFELDLIGQYQDIYSSYSDNLKRNLKKAGKAGLSLLEKSDPKPVIDLFIANQGEKYSFKQDPGMKKLSHLIYTCLHKGLARVLSVYSPQNQVCAGAFFIKSGRKWIFLFSGSDQYARENAAMPFLIDSFIRKMVPTDATLDFEGSNDPGLARFYAGFGAKKFHYPTLEIIRLGFPLNTLHQLYKKFR